MKLKTKFIAEFQKFLELVQFVGDGEFEIAPFISEERIKLLFQYNKALKNMQESGIKLRSINAKIDTLSLVKNKLLSQPISQFGHSISIVWDSHEQPAVSDGLVGNVVFGTKHADFLKQLGFLKLVGRFRNPQEYKMLTTFQFIIGQPVRSNKAVLREFFKSQESLLSLQHELTSVNNRHRANCATVAQLHQKLLK